MVSTIKLSLPRESVPSRTCSDHAHTLETVPKPRPGVFRITKNIHNILQGVSHPDQRITAEEKQAIIDWITENASRYWLSEGGPLRPVEEGGAHVVIVGTPSLSTPTLLRTTKPLSCTRG
jgi:hypothetical protein